jgi:hypothetical protein
LGEVSGEVLLGEEGAGEAEVLDSFGGSLNRARAFSPIEVSLVVYVTSLSLIALSCAFGVDFFAVEDI